MTSRFAAIGPMLFMLTALHWPLQAAATDVVLALDRSLSMNENDPSLVSLKGAQLFAELLNPDDRLALMTFAQDGVTLLPLTRLTDRKRLNELIRHIRMDGTRTDFEAALRAAEQNFSTGSEATAGRRILVLFSDGQLNVGTVAGNHVSHEAISKELIPRFQAAGIRIYGVAFSPKADLDFLTRLAEATGGQASRANTPADIYTAFVRLFEQTDQPLSVPVTDGEVKIDANVQELKLLVKHEPGDGPMRLTDPSNRDLVPGAQQAGVDWQSTPEFDRITIQNPEAGSWKVMAGNGEKKAYIESNLDLTAKLPVMARIDETIPVTARLSYQGAPVDPSLLKNARFTVVVRDDSDIAQQQIALKPDPGAQDYHGELHISAPGTYQAQVSAEGLGFQRSKTYFISLVGAQQALPDLLPADAVPANRANEQQTAIVMILAANLTLLILGVAGFGIWRWRRQRHHIAPNDIDLDD